MDIRPTLPSSAVCYAYTYVYEAQQYSSTTLPAWTNGLIAHMDLSLQKIPGSLPAVGGRVGLRIYTWFILILRSMYSAVTEARQYAGRGNKTHSSAHSGTPYTYTILPSIHMRYNSAAGQQYDFAHSLDKWWCTQIPCCRKFREVSLVSEPVGDRVGLGFRV